MMFKLISIQLNSNKLRDILYSGRTQDELNARFEELDLGENKSAQKEFVDILKEGNYKGFLKPLLCLLDFCLSSDKVDTDSFLFSEHHDVPIYKPLIEWMINEMSLENDKTLSNEFCNENLSFIVFRAVVKKMPQITDLEIYSSQPLLEWLVSTMKDPGDDLNYYLIATLSTLYSDYNEEFMDEIENLTINDKPLVQWIGAGLSASQGDYKTILIEFLFKLYREADETIKQEITNLNIEGSNLEQWFASNIHDASEEDKELFTYYLYTLYYRSNDDIKNKITNLKIGEDSLLTFLIKQSTMEREKNPYFMTFYDKFLDVFTSHFRCLGPNVPVGVTFDPNVYRV